MVSGPTAAAAAAAAALQAPAGLKEQRGQETGVGQREGEPALQLHAGEPRRCAVTSRVATPLVEEDDMVYIWGIICQISQSPSGWIAKGWGRRTGPSIQWSRSEVSWADSGRTGLQCGSMLGKDGICVTCDADVGCRLSTSSLHCPRGQLVLLGSLIAWPHRRTPYLVLSDPDRVRAARARFSLAACDRIRLRLLGVEASLGWAVLMKRKAMGWLSGRDIVLSPSVRFSWGTESGKNDCV